MEIQLSTEEAKILYSVLVKAEVLIPWTKTQAPAGYEEVIKEIELQILNEVCPDESNATK